MIYERALFNRRKQENNETVEEFIADLHKLVKHCSYGTLQDELVRNRIVVGVKGRQVSEKLQMTANLTLELAMTTARQSEAVKTQQPLVRGEASRTVTVEAIGGKSRCAPAQHGHRAGKRNHRVSTQTTKMLQVWQVAASWSPAVPN